MNRNWNIEFSIQAEKELESHIAFYEDQREGLGDVLAEELSENLQAVVTFPHAQVRYDAIRCIPLKRFPFMVHFSVIEDRQVIRVQAIIHTARNPNKNWGSEDWIVNEELAHYLAQVIVLELEPVAT